MFARWSAATVLATALAVAPAHSDPVANFYKRRQVDLIVGSGPGGGYDIYARLLARHFGKFIPGHPPVIVQNMPGGGSLRAVNFLYNLAPKDGTTIGTSFPVTASAVAPSTSPGRSARRASSIDFTGASLRTIRI